MPGRLLRVRTGRHPHEILLVVAATLLGIVGAIFPESISDAVATAFPWPWSMALWIFMALSGLVTLWGIFNHKIEGLLVERAGLTLQATGIGLYVYCVFEYAGFSGLVSMVLPGAIIIGHLSRCWQIKRDLALLTAYMKDHPGEKVR